MRHLYGAVLAVVVAAGVFFGATWGYARVTRHTPGPLASGTPAVSSLLHNTAVLEGGGALLAVGLAIGLLMTVPWVSPLAAGLPGLVLLAWTVLYLSDVRQALRLIPLKNHDFGAGFETLLVSGLLGAAGIAMVIPLFIPSRWRRRTADGTAAAGASTLVTPRYGADLEQTVTTFEPAETGQSNVLTDWAQTRPQPPAGPTTPPSGSQAPWGPAGYS